MLRARFTFSEKLLFEGLDGHHATRPSRTIQTGVRILAMIALVTLIGLMSAKGNIAAALVLAGFAALLGFSRRIDRAIIARRFRHSPYVGSEISFVLDENGVYSSCALGITSLRWEAVTRIVGLETGFLLYQGPSAYNWLPLIAFEQPDRAAIAAFLLAQERPYEERAGPEPAPRTGHDTTSASP